MRRLILVLVLLAAGVALHDPGCTTASASPPPVKPQPTLVVDGHPVYDMNVLKHTPGVTIKRTLVDMKHKNPAFPAAATRAGVSNTSSTATTGYGFSYTYNSYNQVTGDVYLYAWINTPIWYGVPLCAQAETRTYSYPGYVSVRTTQQFYLSYFGGFGLYAANQGWTSSSGYTDLLTGCYPTIPGDTWYNLSSFSCMASYYCSGSAVSQWSDY